MAPEKAETAKDHREIENVVLDVLHNEMRGLKIVSAPRFVSVTGDDTFVRVSTSFEGFSPSLHKKRLDLAWLNTSKALEEDGNESLIERVRNDIKKIMTRQKIREQDALDLGYEKYPRINQINHLSVDVVFPEITEKPRKQLIETVTNGITRVQQAGNYSGQSLVFGAGIIVGEKLQNDKWIRFAFPTMKIKNKLGREVANIRGLEIKINAPDLPESVLVSMIGKRLGDLAEIHPSINDRIIKSIKPEAYKGQSGLLIGYEVDVELLEKVLPAATN